jgi:hypothetical protein
MARRRGDPGRPARGARRGQRLTASRHSPSTPKCHGRGAALARTTARRRRTRRQQRQQPNYRRPAAG